MFEKLYSLLESKSYRALKAELTEFNEVDLAEFIIGLEPEATLAVFRMLDKDVASDVFSRLDADSQQKIIESFSDSELRPLIEDLFTDDAVDMLGEMPANIVMRVLKNVKKETRELINRFLNYPDGSAGSVMTSEFVDLREDMTIGEAIEYIRRTGVDKETVYCGYVTDAKRVLIGVISFRELLCAPDEQTVGENMISGVISVTTTETAEDAANLLSKYDFLAIPVTDNENRLCGILTYDDAMDVFREEATEDFHKMAAVTPLEKPYLKTKVFELYKNRIPWLILLMFSSMLSGIIIEQFEPIIVLIPMLVAFMPMLTATGGNCGAQTSTIVIRELATGGLTTADAWRVLVKELGVGALCGAALAVVNFVRVMLMYGSNTEVMRLAFLVSGCLFITVIFSKILGGLLPLIAKKLGADPAITAAPFITTAVDALSIFLLYGSATLIFIK